MGEPFDLFRCFRSKLGMGWSRYYETYALLGFHCLAPRFGVSAQWLTSPALSVRPRWLPCHRKLDTTRREAGGITQSMGAFSVSLGDRVTTFIDTPGHAAFK